MNNVTPINNRVVDPALALEREVVVLENEWVQIEATIARIRQFHAAMLAENERLREERDRLELFTEEEVSKMLKLRLRSHLQDLRYQHNLPHRKIGKEVVYTRSDIAEILEYFKANPRAGRQLRKAA